MSTKEKNTEENSDTIYKIKAWLAPGLFSIIGMLVWRDVSETKADVKLLLENQSANKVRIEHIQEEIDVLKKYYYAEKSQKEVFVFKQPAKKEDELEIR